MGQDYGFFPKHRRGIVIALLIVATAAAYAPVLHNGFVFDDLIYIEGNPRVTTGLTAENIGWAFTTSYAGNWHPLTWISLQLDSQLFGATPSGYHLVNVAFHIANTILLLIFLWRITEAVWRSAIVAGLFALHPLHVESVAWASERKDILSTAFFLLTLLAYVQYVKRRRLGWYVAVAAFLALGLLAKQMLVTVPAVLLLLDFWPLGRWSRAGDQDSVAVSQPMLILEKLPLLALVIIASLFTIRAQRDAICPLEQFPLSVRFINATTAYVRYLLMTVWPNGLAAFYPFPPGVLLDPDHLSVRLIVGAVLAAALLIGVSLSVIRLAGRRPYLLVGWFWYLGTLVPVIGLVQVGSQALADRYTYVPHIGLFLMLVWGLADLAVAWRIPTRVAGGVVVAGLTACGALTWNQVHSWHDHHSLWGHAVAVTKENYFAHYNLGLALQQEKQLPAAAQEYRRAVAINPLHGYAHNNLGTVLQHEGRHDAALEEFREAARLNPEYAKAQTNLGAALARAGKMEEGKARLETALQLDPAQAEAHYNLGLLFERQGQVAEAIRCYAEAVRLDPGRADAWTNLGYALKGQGKDVEALDCFRRAVEAEPSDTRMRANLALALDELGQRQAADEQFQALLRLAPNWPEQAASHAWQLATQASAAPGDDALAVRLAERAYALSGGRRPEFLDALAAAYAAAHRFEDAGRAAKKGIALATDLHRSDLVQGLEQRLALYEKRQPFRGK